MQPWEDLDPGPDCRSVRWRGKDYTFTPLQARAVEVLLQHRGRPVSQARILTEIESEAGRLVAGRPRGRLRDVFKSGGQIHPAWGDLIVLPPAIPGESPRKGLFMIPGPTKTPAEAPGAPHTASHSQTQEDKGVSTAPKKESDMEEQRSHREHLEAEVDQLLSNLGKRHYLRVLVRCGRLLTLAPREDLDAVAEDFDALPLFLGLMNGVSLHSEVSCRGLGAVEAWLDGLANTWAPAHIQDPKTQAEIEAFPAERRERTCSPKYVPTAGRVGAVCPRCGGPGRTEENDTGAWSRKDSTTMVCSPCGGDEGALIHGAQHGVRREPSRSLLPTWEEPDWIEFVKLYGRRRYA